MTNVLYSARALTALGAMALFSSATTAQETRVVVGPVTWVSASRPATPFIEPHLAIDPTNPNRLVATAVGYPAPGVERIVAFYSRDGGATWAESDLGESLAGVDPWLAFSPGGTVSLLSLPDELVESADGGATFNRRAMPVLEQQVLDYPKAIYTPSGRLAVWVAGGSSRRQGVAVGSLHLFLIPPGDDAEPLHRQVAPGAINYQVGAIAALGDGTLLAPVQELTAAGDFLAHPRLWMARFDDEGNLLHPLVLVSEEFLADSPDIAVGPAPDSGGEHAYMAWMAVTADRASWNHQVAASTDGGVTWSDPVDLLGAPEMPSYLPHHPMVAVDGAGVVAATFKAPVADSTGDRCFGFYVTASTDGGVTFLPPVEVGPETCADAPGNRVPVSEREGAATVVRRFGDGGDYHGLVGMPGGGFRVLWADSRTGVYQLYSAEVVVRR